jgi:hypothetical protein
MEDHAVFFYQLQPHPVELVWHQYIRTVAGGLEKLYTIERVGGKQAAAICPAENHTQVPQVMVDSPSDPLLGFIVSLRRHTFSQVSIPEFVQDIWCNSGCRYVAGNPDQMPHGDLFTPGIDLCGSSLHVLPEKPGEQYSRFGLPYTRPGKGLVMLDLGSELFSAW